MYAWVLALVFPLSLTRAVALHVSRPGTGSICPEVFPVEDMKEQIQQRENQALEQIVLNPEIPPTASTNTTVTDAPLVIPTIDLNIDKLPIQDQTVHEPGWIKTVEGIIQQLTDAASAVGVNIVGDEDAGGSSNIVSSGVPITPITAAENYLDRSCPKLNIADRGTCVLELLIDVMDRANVVLDVVAMVPRVVAGGNKAKAALLSLLELSSDPLALKTMSVLQLGMFAGVLARKESTPDFTRSLALSLVTKLKGIPAIVSIDDVATGTFSHLDVVIPSKKQQDDTLARYVRARTGASVFDDVDELPRGGFEVFAST